MAEIVNLKQRRKLAARAAKESKAAANRAAFGRSKAEKREAAAERLRLARDLAGKKLEDT